MDPEGSKLISLSLASRLGSIQRTLKRYSRSTVRVAMVHQGGRAYRLIYVLIKIDFDSWVFLGTQTRVARLQLPVIHPHKYLQWNF